MTDETKRQKTIDEGIVKKGGINNQNSNSERPPNPIGQGDNSNSQNSSQSEK